MAGLGRRTFAPGEVLTASNVMNYLQDQVIQTYAGTAARGSAIGTAVSEGMVSYLADSKYVEVFDGSDWISALPVGAWQSYTPSFVNFTLGNGTITASKYVQIGKTVHLQVSVTLGSTSVVGTQPTISLPISAKNDFVGQYATVSGCTLFAGSSLGVGTVQLITTTTCRMFVIRADATYSTSAGVTATIPGTWTTGNFFGFSFTYEVD
jgi:hypothetical protein